MNDKIIIRKVKPSDAEQFIDLVNFVWRHAYKDIFPEEVFKDKENKRMDKIKTFSEIHYNDNKTFCYVAECDNEIVGIIFGTIKSGYKYFEKMNYADLVGLYIHPKYQGLGIATQFRMEFVKWLKDNGANKYVIGVLKDNAKARNVYGKWGGKLNFHTQLFYKLGVGYEEVFYTYEI